MMADFAGRKLDLSQIQVMGVLNVTPDSFSDGGLFNNVDAALKQSEIMLQHGASIIDVGGESTRPGALPVCINEELDRVCPIVERLVADLGAIVSVDTSTPEVMVEALRLGAGMINDVRGFSRQGAVEAVSDSDAMLCVMHMQGNPGDMQDAPHYQSVVEEVQGYLQGRVSVLMEAGVSASKIVLDPGFGFGKTLEHNLLLLNGISEIVELGYPVLIGLSRKSMLGAILDKPVDQRLYASLSGAVVAAQQGAKIIRVHDVEASVDAMKVVNAMQQAVATYC